MPDTPRPIIILGTGRSFTSVICCMIGQHPDMIGLPETNIFRDKTLGEVYRRFGQGPNAQRRAGLLRTLAYFHDGEQTDETIEGAEQFLAEHQHWSAREIAEYIVKLAAPRGIVEKSISTCREPETLARAREIWPDAFFLHITRQPESIVNSMQSRIDGAFEKGKGRRLRKLLEDHSLDEYYTRYTTTILEFMATLPPGRGMNLHGEHFLTDARLYCRQICDWTGLENSESTIEAMMHPENNPFAHRGPSGAVKGMSATFLDNPTYSGEPVAVKPLTIDMDDPELSDDRRLMVLLGNRLGYV
jgi:hypothetical protein